MSNKQSHKQIVIPDQSIVITKSVNDQIGYLPPGPISNESLFEKINPNLLPLSESSRLKRGLLLNQDYRKVNK